MAQGDKRAEIEAPAAGGVGLLIIDMINDMAFPGAEGLREKAPSVAEVVRSLRDEAERLGVPVVYVNDNYGQWHSEKSRIVKACLGANETGQEIATHIAPRDDDYFIIKPQFSGFYATNLPVLLPRLGVNRLVLTGMAADVCVLFTAADAHMREYQIWTPRDAVASEKDERANWALEIMQKSMGAEIRPTGELALRDWVHSCEYYA